MMDSNIVAALAALAGVTLGHAVGMLQAHLARRVAAKAEYRQKLQELAQQVSAAMEWAEYLAAKREFGAPPQKTESLAELPMAARHAEVLALIYFPTLRGLARRHLVACGEYMSAVAEQADRPSSAAQAELTRSLGAMVSAREALDAAIGALAESSM